MWIFPESDYNIFSHYKGNSSHDLQLKYNNLVIIFTHNHEKKSQYLDFLKAEQWKSVNFLFKQKVWSLNTIQYFLSIAGHSGRYDDVQKWFLVLLQSPPVTNRGWQRSHITTTNTHKLKQM